MKLYKAKSLFIGLLEYVSIIFIVLFVITNIVSLQQIIGSSMSPTLNSGNVLLLDKVSYKFLDIKRNDIVVFSYEDILYVKRVIGLPGERIEYKNNLLYINDVAYKEIVVDDMVTADFALEYKEIPRDMYFVMGDNRSNSRDSRDIGLISKNDVVGKTKFRIWPLNKIGFVM